VYVDHLPNPLRSTNHRIHRYRKNHRYDHRKSRSRPVGGTLGSAHLPEKDRVNSFKGGGGIDIRTANIQEQFEIAFIARQVGFRGIGIPPNGSFIHLDYNAAPSQSPLINSRG